MVFTVEVRGIFTAGQLVIAERVREITRQTLDLSRGGKTRVGERRREGERETRALRIVSLVFR